jgi:hypothetical protein
VGSRSDASAPAQASGALELVGVDLVLGGDLSIGGHAPLAGTGSALGSLTSDGNVTVGGGTGVGFGSPLEDQSGVGTLAIAGDLETTRALGVGIGTGSGEAAIGGDVRVIGVESGGTGFSFGEVSVGSLITVGLSDAPATPATGSLSIGGDLEFVYGGGHGRNSSGLAVGTVQDAGSVDGFADIAGDVLGFRDVSVGVAGLAGAVGAEADARGELHIAGRLSESHEVIGGALYSAILAVGTTSPGVFASGTTRAEGYATIGEVESRVAMVGVAGAGPAIGRVEIGSGDLRSADVGITHGDSDAEGTLVTGGGVLGTARVGVSEGGGEFLFDCMCITPFTTGNAVGSMTADGLVHSAEVGVLRSDGSAIGSLEVEGVRQGNLSTTGSVLVGYSDRGGPDGTAEGRMLVRSGGIEATRIAVGVLEGSNFPTNNRPRPAGTVTGVLETTGDVTSRGGLGIPGVQPPADLVGYANSLSHGDVDGTWILHEGTYTGRRLLVGGSDGTGTGTGRLHLDRMFVDLDELLLGDGATVEIDIAGLLRGTQYSAIDADAAALRGDLAIAFTAPAKNGVYDLIVSAALDGIFGDFDSVTVAGLGAGQSASWGIETTGGTSPVEVWRLRVVPEPTSGALVAFGLLALAIRSRRTRAA